MSIQFKEEELQVYIQNHAGELSGLIVEHFAQVSAAPHGSSDADPVGLLPRGLRRKLLHRAAFRRAFETGLLTVEAGVVEHHFRSKGVLAYFCGRCFSDDKSEKVFKQKVWRKGDRAFPAEELNALFGETNLKECRKNGMKNKIPNGTEEVDNLFVVP